MEKVKSEKKRETPIGRRQLAAVLVFALVMMLALIPGVIAGDPTGAKTLEEERMRFVDANIFILLKRNVIVEAVSDKNYIECVLLADEEGPCINDALAYLLMKRKRGEGVCDLFKNQKVVSQQSL